MAFKSALLNVVEDSFSLSDGLRSCAASVKYDGSLVTSFDLLIQKNIFEYLASAFPGCSVLGEEMSLSDQQAALSNPNGCWVLDPIDGTTNFASGFPVFSVSLALVVDSEVVLGLVYDPVRRELFSARKGLGAELNGMSLTLPQDVFALEECIAIIDFKRLPAEWVSSIWQKPPFRSHRSLGSVALEWCWLAAGRAHIFAYAQHGIWDYAAAHLILQEAGGACCGFDGSPVFVPRVEKRSALAAQNAKTLHAWYAWFKTL